MSSNQTLMLQASVDNETERNKLLGEIRVFYRQIGLLGNETIDPKEPMLSSGEIINTLLRTTSESIHLVTKDGVSATFEKRPSIPFLRGLRHPVIAVRRILGK